VVVAVIVETVVEEVRRGDGDNEDEEGRGG
jgi:hypothetical protein